MSKKNKDNNEEEDLFVLVATTLLRGEETNTGKIVKFKNTDYMIEMFNNELKEESANEVIRVLDILNEEVLKLQKIGNEKLLEEKKSILNFNTWFSEKYEDREDILDAVNEEWQKRNFPIFEMVFVFNKLNFIKNYYDIYKDLPQKDKMNIYQVMEYIMAWEVPVYVTASYVNDGVYFGNHLITEDSSVMEYGCAMAEVVKLFCESGGMVIRIIAEEDVHIINGLIFLGNKIAVMREDDLQEAMESMPDGETNVREYEVYEEAPLDFIYD